MQWNLAFSSDFYRDREKHLWIVFSYKIYLLIFWHGKPNYLCRYSFTKPACFDEGLLFLARVSWNVKWALSVIRLLVTKLFPILKSSTNQCTRLFQPKLNQTIFGLSSSNFLKIPVHVKSQTPFQWVIIAQNKYTLIRFKINFPETSNGHILTDLSTKHPWSHQYSSLESLVQVSKICIW